MPAITNRVVKKNDNTTDVTFTAVVPSSGDKSPAIWKNQAVGSADSHRPRFEMMARQNNAGTIRWITVRGYYPQIATNSTTTLTSVISKVTFEGSFAVPVDMAAADVNEAISQTCHLLAHADTKADLKSLYAPS